MPFSLIVSPSAPAVIFHLSISAIAKTRAELDRRYRVSQLESSALVPYQPSSASSARDLPPHLRIPTYPPTQRERSAYGNGNAYGFDEEDLLNHLDSYRPPPPYTADQAYPQNDYHNRGYGHERARRSTTLPPRFDTSSPLSRFDSPKPHQMANGHHPMNGATDAFDPFNFFQGLFPSTTSPHNGTNGGAHDSFGGIGGGLGADMFDLGLGGSPFGQFGNGQTPGHGHANGNNSSALMGMGMGGGGGGQDDLINQLLGSLNLDSSTNLGMGGGGPKGMKGAWASQKMVRKHTSRTGEVSFARQERSVTFWSALFEFDLRQCLTGRSWRSTQVHRAKSCLNLPSKSWVDNHPRG